LIDMAARQSAVRIGALALADGPSHLERRIRAMQWTRGRLAAARGLVLGGMGGLLVLAACEAKVPTASDVAQMDVAGAQRTVSDAGFVAASDATDFFVNGVRVTADKARALEAKDIGSIEVVKSELPTGRDTIFVTTADRMPKGLKTELRARESEGEGKGAQQIVQSKIVRDSTEHMVAHVERELDGMRLRTVSDGKAPEKPQPSKVRTANPGAEPVYLIDGKQASSSALAAIKGDEISSIAVYKGVSAKVFAPQLDSKNGVIVVTTKRAKKN
jgi:hypothetical protein